MASCASNTNGTPCKSPNKRDVMCKAWELYRHTHTRYAKWQLDRGLADGSFSHALKTAWRIMKEIAAETARKAAELVGPNAARIAGIRSMIDSLKYRSFGHNIRMERAALENEIAVLVGRAA